MKNLKTVLYSVLAISMIGCAGPQMPVAGTFAPQLQRMAAPQIGAQASPQGQLFTVHFVKSYKGAIAENEPINRNDPDGPAAALIKLIQTAQKTLDGAFYDIHDPGVVNALIAARQRGVRVRIVTDTDNMVSRDPGSEGQPREAIVALQKNGVPVVDDKRSGIMHHKFLVQDGATVWTGSTNLTETSLYQHNNNALTIRLPQLAENYSYEFERMFTQKIFGPRPERQIPHPVIKVGNTTIRNYFSPKGGGQEAVLATLQQAQKDISFMTFSFTDKNIGALMVDKKSRGVQVQGVFDQCLGYGKYSQYHTLKKANIYTRMDGNQALLHHKIILSDDTVITGSYNYSANAEKSNNENFLIIENSYVSAMYRQEFQRVMNAAKYNRPPEGKCPGQDD